MPNIHFAMLASPDKHAEFIKNVNKWKYDIEGKKAKGKQSPYVSEMKFYEVRVPEELEAQFVRDMELYRGWENFGGSHNWTIKTLFKIYEFVLWFTPWRKLNASKKYDKKEFDLGPGWHYTVALGAIKRPKRKVRDGTPREIL
jgi:hypothetical protein